MSINHAVIEEKILDAAQCLLREAGDGFSLEELESRTQISRSTIYRRLGNKEAILARLAAQRGEDFTPLDIRSAILTGARRLFGRVGLTGATMEQIAGEAGVGVATVYRHFGDKENLLQAFIEEMTPRSAVRALSLQPTADVAGDLGKIVEAMLVFFFDNRDIFRLVLTGGESEQVYLSSLRAGSDSSLARLTDYFQAQLGAGRLAAKSGADQMALALMGMVLSFAVIGPLHYSTTLDDPPAISRLIVDLFLGDLRTAPAQQPSVAPLQKGEKL